MEGPGLGNGARLSPDHGAENERGVRVPAHRGADSLDACRGERCKSHFPSYAYYGPLKLRLGCEIRSALLQTTRIIRDKQREGDDGDDQGRADVKKAQYLRPDASQHYLRAEDEGRNDENEHHQNLNCEFGGADSNRVRYHRQHEKRGTLLPVSMLLEAN